MSIPTSWAAQQLTEFLAVVSAAPDEASAVDRAVERAVEAFDAEIGAIVGPDEVIASRGFGTADVVRWPFADVIEGRSSRLAVCGIGECQALATPIEDERLQTLVLARDDELPFTSEDRGLARSMARVLALTVRLLRVLGAERELREISERQSRENRELLESLGERQRLLERLSKIQSSIVSATSTRSSRRSSPAPRSSSATRPRVCGCSIRRTRTS